MTTIVVGAGITGLVVAKRAREMLSDEEIIVIDSARLGGLLSGTDYSGSGHGRYFDIGTHIYQETGNPDLDNLLTGNVRPHDLVQLPQDVGDLSGAVFHGQLQSNSHFPDLRGKDAFADIRSSMLQIAETKSSGFEIDRFESLQEASVRRFGVDYTSGVLAPMLEHVFDRPSNELAGFAMLLPGATRVILDDEVTWKEKSNSDAYRALVGFPEQRRLPDGFKHGKLSYYSRSRGSAGIVEALASRLTEAGVKLLTECSVSSLDLQRNTLSITTKRRPTESLSFDRLIIATGAIGAARLLSVDLESFKLERPMPHWILNLELAEESPSDLCYVYGFDNDCDWYRVTNYRAFSGRAEDRRLTIEVLGDRIGDPINCVPDIVSQLYEVGLVGSERVEFADSFALQSGFPVPSTANLRGIDSLAKHVRGQLGRNQLLCGIGSRDGLFFQNEVLRQAYADISNFFA